MDCTCPEGYTLSGEECVKITTISNIVCPAGCTTVVQPNGNAICNCVDITDPEVTTEKTPIYFDNNEYFEDVSWTIAFKAGEGWSSYFSFYPDYSISHLDYFQVGYNWNTFKESLWAHTLGNRSFQVFQGVLNPSIIEFPIVNENTNKIFNTISLNVEAKRWQNKWDFSQHPEIGFNKVNIHNNTNNSHNLELVEQRTLAQVSNYPKTKSSSQEILFTAEDEKHTFNYFYNRIKNERNNIPQFNWDKNRIFKEVNLQAVSFYGKSQLERLRGESALVTLTNDKESRFSIILKNTINQTTNY